MFVSCCQTKKSAPFSWRFQPLIQKASTAIEHLIMLTIANEHFRCRRGRVWSAAVSQIMWGERPAWRFLPHHTGEVLRKKKHHLPTLKKQLMLLGGSQIPHSIWNRPHSRQLFSDPLLFCMNRSETWAYAGWIAKHFCWRCLFWVAQHLSAFAVWDESNDKCGLFIINCSTCQARSSTGRLGGDLLTWHISSHPHFCCASSVSPNCCWCCTLLRSSQFLCAQNNPAVAQTVMLWLQIFCCTHVWIRQVVFMLH